MSRRRRAALAVAALVPALHPAPLAAQEERRGAPGGLGARAEACSGQTVTEIRVTTLGPFQGRRHRLLDFAIKLANRLHATTRPALVQRFLLLEVGQPCTERRRSESERLLRAQPYIADAVVTTVSDGSGGVIVSVQTIDEFTPILSLHAGRTKSVKIGDGNVLGTGRHIEAEWGRGTYRDTYAGRLIDYQFLGQPWILEVAGGRRDLGVAGWQANLAHPFYVDEQRIAWRIDARRSEELFHFLRGAAEPVRVGLERRFYDVGGVVRVGLPGRLSLFGLSFSSERDDPRLPPIADSAVDYSGLLGPGGRFRSRNNARVNALWGVRNLYFRKVERFDALNATQDIRIGFQLGMIFGRSISVLGATDDDILVGSDLLAAFGNDRTYFLLQGRGEGRYDYDANDHTGDWDGIVASASGSLYRRLGGRHTFVLTGDWGAGWRQRIPLQLTLGDHDGGVRGYKDSRLAGGRRLVFRLEDRWYLGGLLGHADFGISPFVDAGLLRRGDAPFSTETGPRVGAGLGFLVAVPRGAARTWRLDLARAVSKDQDARWEVRLTSFNARPRGYREPRDITRSREQVVPSSVFSWP